MIVSAHQPNWMPWLGFWNKVASSDKMILLDSVQYTKNSYINRVELFNGAKRFWWTVPVFKSGGKINSIEICPDSSREKLWNQFWDAYHKSKYFSEVADIIFKMITYPTDSLSTFNINALGTISKLFRMENRFILQSDLKESVKRKNDLLADLCNQLNADFYLSGQFARKYLDEKPFNNMGIKIVWQKIPKIPNGLSIVDALCNYGIDKTKEMIKS